MLLSRIGDIVVGNCTYGPISYPAVGVIATGSFLYNEGGLPVARMGDIAMFPCGAFVITVGSFNMLEAGLPVARIGAPCVGSGSGIITTSSFVHIQV